jgi:hypothetical protein
MAALTPAVTKPRPVRTITRSMVHSADGDQYRLVRYPQRVALMDEGGDAVPSCRERLGAHDEQVEDSGHDDDPDSAGNNPSLRRVARRGRFIPYHPIRPASPTWSMTQRTGKNRYKVTSTRQPGHPAQPGKPQTGRSSPAAAQAEPQRATQPHHQPQTRREDTLLRNAHLFSATAHAAGPSFEDSACRSAHHEPGNGS